MDVTPLTQYTYSKIPSPRLTAVDLGSDGWQAGPPPPSCKRIPVIRESIRGLHPSLADCSGLGLRWLAGNSPLPPPVVNACKIDYQKESLYLQPGPLPGCFDLLSSLL
jgi:hypothetical protein